MKSLFFGLMFSVLFVQAQEKPDTEYDRQLSKAKVLTNNSCETQQFLLVWVEGSSRKPVLVVFGQVISMSEQSNYRLVVQGNEVTLQRLETIAEWSKRLPVEKEKDRKVLETWVRNRFICYD